MINDPGDGKDRTPEHIVFAYNLLKKAGWDPLEWEVGIIGYRIEDEQKTEVCLVTPTQATLDLLHDEITQYLRRIWRFHH